MHLLIRKKEGKKEVMNDERVDECDGPMPKHILSHIVEAVVAAYCNY